MKETEQVLRHRNSAHTSIMIWRIAYIYNMYVCVCVCVCVCVLKKQGYAIAIAVDLNEIKGLPCIALLKSEAYEARRFVAASSKRCFVFAVRLWHGKHSAV